SLYQKVAFLSTPSSYLNGIDHKGQYISKRGMGVDPGRATTRAHPQRPLPARPYYTTNRPAKPVYSRGRGGCGRGDGALVAARPCFFEMYCPLWGPCLGTGIQVGSLPHPVQKIHA